MCFWEIAKNTYCRPYMRTARFWAAAVTKMREIVAAKQRRALYVRTTARGAMREINYLDGVNAHISERRGLPLCCAEAIEIMAFALSRSGPKYQAKYWYRNAALSARMMLKASCTSA